MMNWFWRMIPCQHEYGEPHKWKDGDGTPMATVYCTKCGKCDSGPVYADPETWLP